jgi:AcrR family transcriptional regulator
MTPPDPQQLITDRKNQILEAAAVVFAEKGFHPATTKDIAKQAGISEGTIYNYFESKSALLIGIFDRMRTSVIQENVTQITDDLDFRAFIRLFLQQPLMALKQDNFALFRIVVSEMMVNEELRVRYYEQILEPTLTLGEAYFQAHAEKRGLSRANTKLTLRAISGMVMGLMITHILGDQTLDERWDELPDFLTTMLLHGLNDNPSL